MYVDGSGDHGLDSVNDQFPIFVLSFCLFKQEEYASMVLPAIIMLKFRHFGHDMVVLHERDIRKRHGPFSEFNEAKRIAFLEEPTSIIETGPFGLIAVVIRKLELRRHAELALENPYHLALRVGMEKVDEHLRECGAASGKTYFVVEQRGKREDEQLELEFRRIADGLNSRNMQLPFKIHFSHKQSNSAGLQFADMTARPIGLRILRPGQRNRAAEVLDKKLVRGRMMLD